MASIVTYDGGLKRIEFGMSATERPRVIRLGRITQKRAESFKAKVEAIIADKLQGRPHDPDVADWLGKLDEKMLAKLRKAGLADGVGLMQVTLKAFLERWFNARTCKPQTTVFYGHTRRNLEDYFQDRFIRDITAEDAERWRAWLVSEQGLSQATVSRRVKAARSMWKSAIRWKLALDNPFAGVRAGSQANEARTVFVSQDVIEKVISNAPDAEWRAIIALARYGGLRTPSETFALRWVDIDWEAGQMKVSVPKLEHLEGHGQRIVPLFAELRPFLDSLLLDPASGSEYVITRHRMGCANLRTQFERIITKAKVKSWPRLFHNLRGSRETELMREYDLKTVCSWIGNSPEVAARHYATSVDLNADFRRAAGLDVEAQEKAQRKAADTSSSSRPEADDDNPQVISSSEDVLEFLLVAGGDKLPLWAREDSNL